LKVDVSLTSYGNRIYFLPLVLFSIIRFKNTLWKNIYIHIDEDEQLNTGKELILWLVKVLYNVKILNGKSLGPHSKYFSYLYQIFENDPFVLIDDDMFYSKKKLEKLINEGELSQFNTSLRCVRAKFKNQKFEAYKNWKAIHSKENSPYVFATNVGGTYVKPIFANAIKSNIHLLKHFPKADDVFFFFIALKEKMPYQSSEGFYDPTLIPFTQANALWKKNVDNGGNDHQIHAISKLIDLSEADFQ